MKSNGPKVNQAKKQFDQAMNKYTQILSKMKNDGDEIIRRSSSVDENG